jgi:hypothetical protein
VKYGRSADNFVRPVAQFSLLLTPTFVHKDETKMEERVICMSWQKPSHTTLDLIGLLGNIHRCMIGIPDKKLR